MLRRFLVLVVGALGLVPAATAGSVLPEGASIDPLLSQIATGIAGTPTQVYCHTSADWAPPDGDPSHGGYATRPNRIDISPLDCEALKAYASADQKPTMCGSWTTVSSTISEKVRYRKTIRVKIRGKLVKRRVWRTKIVAHPVEKNVPGPLVTCWRPGGTQVIPRGAGYSAIAHAIQTVAHESIHVLDYRTGVAPTETHAECAGMAAAPAVAVALGGTLEDGQALIAWYSSDIRPNYPDPTYTQAC
jgi:hypothetical protein